jgi:hypothetical protein
MFSITRNQLLFLSMTALAITGCGGSENEPAPADAAFAGADAATEGASDASSPTSSADSGGNDDSSSAIGCGDDTCAIGSEICCFTGFPEITTMCSAESSCAELVATCDGPEDCEAGEVCCGDMDGASCRMPDACTGFTAAQLCHSNSDCPETNNCHESDFVAWPIC